MSESFCFVRSCFLGPKGINWASSRKTNPILTLNVVQIITAAVIRTNHIENFLRTAESFGRKSLLNTRLVLNIAARTSIQPRKINKKIPE